MVSGPLNEHVKTPPATKSSHTKENQPVDPPNLLEDEGESEYTRANGSTSHAQYTTSHTSFLNFGQITLFNRSSVDIRHID